MKAKRIMLFAIILVVAVSSLGMVSAGLFDSDIQAETFKVAPVDGYSDNNFVGDGVQLISDEKGLLDSITVCKISEGDYNNLIKTKSPASLSNSTFSVDGEDVSDSFELIKEDTSDDMRVVAEKTPVGDFYFITGMFEKDGSYYYVQMMKQDSNPDVSADIQKINEIRDSIEAL